jgi:dihydrofolate synthase/folylpolyglutamate synthase
MITSSLAAVGYTTGLYTSPHLHTWRERVRVDGELITEGELVALVERLMPEVEIVNQKATYGRLTTFELLTVLAFNHFTERRVDFQVLEVGMGGKFDATNIITPEVSIITPISFDHMEVLGNSLAEIATEKAGIIKPGGVVVTSPQPYEAARVIEEVSKSCGARLVMVGSDVTWQGLGFNLSQQQLQVAGRLGSYELSIPLLGRHQLANAATAVAALEVLAERGFNISRENIITGLARVSWPGRLQILGHHPFILADGAHNIDGAQRLREFLEQYLDYDQAILVIGTSDDKDMAGIVSPLVPVFNKVLVTRSQHPRALAPALLAAEFNRHGLEAHITDDVPSAMSKALALARDNDLICVAGSLFIVAEAIEHCKGKVSASGAEPESGL